MKRNSAKLIEGPIGKTIIKLTIPMIFGMISMVMFNLVDTYFVGQMGTDPLAALSFTFPVVLILNSIALGLGMGASAVISRAIGSNNHDQAGRLTTDALLLGLSVVFVFVVIGQLTITPLFTILGAKGEVLEMVREYMRIWYFGVFFVVIPMIGNNALRATGDTLVPGIIMSISAVMNIILDPLFIFGWGPFPAMGIQGAAIATVISRATSMLASLSFLIFRDKLIKLKGLTFKEILRSWKQILYIGLPAAGTHAVLPLTQGVITGIASTYGNYAVAAYGVSSRIEFFALSVTLAMASIMNPFMGQNYGAKKFDRMEKGINRAALFSIIYGGFIYAVLAIFAKPIAAIFNDEPEVLKIIVFYMRISPIAYGLHGVLLIAQNSLNALHKPFHAAATGVFEMFILFIPLAFLFTSFMDVQGIFVALPLAYGLGGTAAFILIKKVLTNIRQKETFNQTNN